MLKDELLLLDGNVSRIVSAFRQSTSMEDQFVAFGMLAELIMQYWPPELCRAMLTSLELRLGLSEISEPPSETSN